MGEGQSVPVEESAAGFGSFAKSVSEPRPRGSKRLRSHSEPPTASEAGLTMTRVTWDIPDTISDGDESEEGAMLAAGMEDDTDLDNLPPLAPALRESKSMSDASLTSSRSRTQSTEAQSARRSDRSFFRRRSMTSLRRSVSLKRTALFDRTRECSVKRELDEWDKLDLHGFEEVMITHNSDVSSDISEAAKKNAAEFAAELGYSAEMEERFARSIEEANGFWVRQVRPLLEEAGRQGEYTTLCVLLYAKMFERYPEMRELFMETDIKKQGRKLMGMFGWLILCLGKAGSDRRLIPRLRELGELHLSFGVKTEHYYPMLECFHATLAEMFAEYYTLRVRFSMAQLYTVVADVMCHSDFTALDSSGASSAIGSSLLSKEEVMQYITSFDDCLTHPKGRLYLEKFMQQHFCHELWQFLDMVRQFKNSPESSKDRSSLGLRIVEQFIDKDAPMPLNLSSETQRRIRESVSITLSPSSSSSEMKKALPLESDIFDVAMSEVRSLAKANVWTKFQSVLIDFSGAHDSFEAWMMAESERKKKKRSRVKLGTLGALHSPSVSHDTPTSLCSTDSRPRTMSDLLSMIGSSPIPDSAFD